MDTLRQSIFPLAMKILRNSFLLGCLGLTALAGCGDDESDLPPPSERKGGGGVAGDDASQKEIDRLKELAKPKNQQN
jgi:hypothetical protein